MSKITKRWRNDLQNCPINKRVHFLCDYSGTGATLFEFVGTLTLNQYTGQVTRGECLEGNPDIFYRSNILYWAEYRTNEEAEALG